MRQEWTDAELARAIEAYHELGLTRARDEFAPEMSVDAFRGRVRRGIARGVHERQEEDVPTDEGDLEPELSLGLRDYEYTGSHFIFVVEGKPVAVRSAQFEQMCRDYSHHGSNMTAAEIGRKNGLPTPLVQRLFRAYGHFKSSAPTTRERIADSHEDFSAIIADAIENDEHRLIESLERARTKVMQRELDRLRSDELAQERLVAGVRVALAELPAPVAPERIHVGGSSKPARPALVMTSDEHLGEYIWGEESFGSNYDTDIGCALLRRHADHAAEWVANGDPADVIVRAFVGDLLHAILGETASGTPLEQDTRAYRVWTMAFDAVRYSINRLRGLAPRVVVKWAWGNHDEVLMTFLAHAIMVAFENEDDVEIEVQPRLFSHFSYGDSLHVFDHGNKIGALSHKAFAGADVVARGTAGEDFHGAENVYTWIGHLHSFTAASNGAHQVYRLPALVPTGDYATGLRLHGQPGAHSFRLDTRGRPDGSDIFFA